MAAATKLIAENRRARHEYHLLDRFEAGLVLTGTEVKSLRDGKADLQRAFGDVATARSSSSASHIPEYTQGNIANHDPDRDRKLLLHRREIDPLVGKVQEKGLTLVPTRLYWKNGRAKVELALARGKDVRDKRRDDRRPRREAPDGAGAQVARPRHEDDRVHDGGCGEEGGHRPEGDQAVSVEVRVGGEEPDGEDGGRERAPDGGGERHRALGGRPGERPLDDREGDERGAEELRVEGRLGKREPEEVVERIPGGPKQEDGEGGVGDRVDAQDERLREPGCATGAIFQSLGAIRFRRGRFSGRAASRGPRSAS